MAKRKKRKKTHGKSRRLSLACGLLTAALIALGCLAGGWFVHHPRQWLESQCATLPKFVTSTLFWFGNPTADITDSLGLTGHDAVYEYDTEAPSGSVVFAGAPRRVGAPAPGDIRILNRGEFLIGWSDRLRHAVWCAYHVTKDAKYDEGNRPGFTKDHAVPLAPSPKDYTNSGYDRGHMVPNYAIVTRYGEEERKKTFMMSNISPQTPQLNRGVWRNVEHRIADLWTAKYGEIWVVVGCISSGSETISGTNIDVPQKFYQLIIAQTDLDVRAVAVLFDQNVPWNAWAARHIVTIDELEELTGLDFNPDLPSFIQEPLEADLPSRLWPIRPLDLFKSLSLQLN